MPERLRKKIDLIIGRLKEEKGGRGGGDTGPFGKKSVHKGQLLSKSSPFVYRNEAGNDDRR